MSDELRRRLEHAPVPDAEAAAGRAWTVVGAAARERSSHRRRRRTLLAAITLGGALAAAGPPGAAVGEWVQRQVAPRAAAPEAVPARRLPADGRLLVRDRGGLAVVGARGERVRIGRHDGAAWSPRGLFVVAWRDNRLAAVTPAGAPRWSLDAPAAVRAARWSPDGFRIAYATADGMLRVVAGDGSGDRPLAAALPAVPAWRPGRPHTLAYVSRDGRVVVRDVDGPAAREAGRSPGGTRALSWSAGGWRLAALSPDRIRVLRMDGRRRTTTLRAGRGARFTAAAYAPAGPPLLARVRRSRGRSTVIAGGQVFSTRSRIPGLAWSVDGRWLMLDARDAGQLIAVRVAGAPRILSYPGGRLDGWSP
ncbi:MAG TPA: hypothetical protein VE526_03660 [Solirubrobacteraceae bacterium]|jgi:hypothetical protein|nr:hypothetical protein [Solirubrobacteraceae bacterium]